MSTDNEQPPAAPGFPVQRGVRPLREGEVMGEYIDFDRTADRVWTNAEYLTRFGLHISERTSAANAQWPREAEDRVNQLLGDLAAKELECQRLRETLNFIATHVSTDWPERCQSNVLAARKALGA